MTQPQDERPRVLIVDDALDLAATERDDLGRSDPAREIHRTCPGEGAGRAEVIAPNRLHDELLDDLASVARPRCAREGLADEGKAEIAVDRGAAQRRQLVPSFL